MKFQVPQFIEVEDKIFGPLTLRQFLYLAGGAGLSFIWYRFIPKIYLSVFLILPTVGFSLALAFYQVNGRPFIETLEAYFSFITNKKLYIWKKDEKIVPKKGVSEEESASSFIPHLSNSKLKDLTWHLDVKENMNPVTEENVNKNFNSSNLNS